MRKQLFLAIFLVFLLFGCVEERAISVTGYETIESIGGMDLTGDGINDVLSYSYRPIPIDQPAGINMVRVVSVAPFSYSFVISSFNEPADLAAAKAAIQEFDSARKQGESSCAARLQLPLASCADPSSCMQNCRSDYCTAAEKSAGSAFGRELLDFKEKSEEMDRTVAELLATQSLPSQDEKEQYIRKIVRLMALSSDLSYNNVFNSRTYNLCAPPDLRLGRLEEAAQKIGVVEIAPDRYRYRVAEIITGGREDGYVFLFIQDTPPIVLTIDELSIDIDNGVMYQRAPLRLGWENVQVDFPRKVLTYDFTSPDRPEETLMSRWSNPQVNERNIKFLGIFDAFVSFPPVSLLLGVSGGVFRLFYSSGLGYYTALGAAASFLLCVAFLAFFLLALGYHALRAYIDRKAVREYLIEQMGPPITDWKTYVGMGAILILICFLLGALYIRPAEMGQLDLATIQVRLASDIPGSISALLFVFGAYTLYIAAEDRLKGLLLGEGYYRIKGATKEENIAAISRLKALTGSLKARVETLSRLGMDVKEEYAVLIAVPTERLEQLMEMGKQNTAKSLIDFHMERMEAMDKALEQKVRIMEENWPVWNSEIEKAVETSEEVPIETLVSIPMQWREWAVSKFISEHRGKALVFEENRIKRKKVSMESLISTALGDIRREGLVQTSIIIHEGKVVANTFSRGNATAGAVLFLKLIDYAKAISRKFGEEEPKRVVVMGRGSAAVYLPEGKFSLLLFAERSRIRELIDEWRKRISEPG
ncbi:MAG: hypothetical protein AB1657_03845 [Candidatus Micrarchaeota archaeon]